MATTPHAPRPRSWEFFFLYALRRLLPLALVVYVMARYDAWKDPAVIALLLAWVLAVLSFQAAIRRTLPKLPRAADPRASA
jgi:hypothetical protein